MLGCLLKSMDSIFKVKFNTKNVPYVTGKCFAKKKNK